MIGAGDVARAASPGAEPGGGFDHGAHDLRVLTHAEIVVGAPDDDFFRSLRRVPHGVRKAAGYPLEVGEDAVAPLDMQTRKSVGKETVKARSARLPKTSLRIGQCSPYRRSKSTRRDDRANLSAVAKRCVIIFSYRPIRITDWTSFRIGRILILRCRCSPQHGRGV